MGVVVSSGRPLMLSYRLEMCFGASSTGRMSALLLVVLVRGLIVVGTEG
jgi:hypothetical protein